MGAHLLPQIAAHISPCGHCAVVVQGVVLHSLPKSRQYEAAGVSAVTLQVHRAAPLQSP